MTHYFRFHDDQSNWWLETQLADLAIALSRQASLQVSFRPPSVVQTGGEELTISTFAEAFTEPERMQCMSAEVFLRALGTLQLTDGAAMTAAVQALRGNELSFLGVQLLCVSEDARMAKCIGRERPGTRLAFEVRIQSYARMLEKNRPLRMRAGLIGDVLLTDAYFAIHQQHLGKQSALEESWYASALLTLSTSIEHASSTQDVTGAVAALMQTLTTNTFTAQPPLKDTTYRLFSFADGRTTSVNAVSDDVNQAAEQSLETRENKRAGEADDASRREQVDVWTQRQKTAAVGAFQKRIEQERSSPAAGDQGRITEDTPETMTTRRGHTDGGLFDDAGEQDDETDMSMNGTTPNTQGSDADIVMVKRQPLSEATRARVQTWASETVDAKRRLLVLFERSFLHRQTQRLSATRFGRLDKQLTKIVTETNPRIFYHKSAVDKPFDVAVQILVDCSGSMYRQLEAVKPFIYLFHDCLLRLGIPHDVCGFWEDTTSAPVHASERASTHLLHVIDWQDGPTDVVAGHIDELQPQLDNRDGLAIRRVGETLIRRTERQKWFFMISDGQPAAQDYHNAVMDTKSAVRLLRMHKVEVIHLCLAEDADDQTMQTLRQMYGDDCMIVQTLRELPVAMERLLATVIRRTTR